MKKWCAFLMAKKNPAPKISAGFFGSVFFVPVLLPCGHASADMPLRFVDVEDTAHPDIQLGIHGPQAIGHILVHGGLRYMKLLGGGAHRRIIFNNVFAQFNGSPFNGSLHTITSSENHSRYYADEQAIMTAFPGESRFFSHFARFRRA